MRKLTSLLLLLLLIPLSSVIFFGLTVKNTLLSSEFITQGLEETGIYAAPFNPSLADDIAKNIVESTEQSDSEMLDEGALNQLSIDPILVSSAIKNIQSSLSVEFGPQYIQAKIEPLVDAFYLWFLGDVDTLQLVVSVEDDLLDRVIKVFQDTATESLMDLPQCVSEEAFAHQEVLMCIPSGATDEQLLPFIETYTEQLESVAREIIPSEIDFAPQLIQTHEYSQLVVIRGYVLLAINALQWLMLSEVVILLVLLWVNRKHIFTRWVGSGMMVGFLLPLVVACIVWFAGEPLLKSTVLLELQSDTKFLLVVRELIENILLYSVHTLGAVMLLLSSIPFIVGFVLVVVSPKYIQRVSEYPVLQDVAEKA